MLLVTLAACGGSSSGGGTKHPSRSPAETLAQLATAGIGTAYAATYDFHDAAKNQTATVKVWSNQPALRVDVIVGTTTASLIVGSSATYSCAITAKGKSCLTVATAGQPLPAPFTAAPTTLFTADLQQLSTAISDYTVTSAPGTAASGSVPSATCFDVTPRASASPAATQVPQGTYCLSTGGLLTAATYPSGNTIRMTDVQTATPDAAQFSPYASPTPLPSSS